MESRVKQKTIARGGYVFAPADPARDGCTFLGWNPAVFTGLTADTTFTAQGDRPSSTSAGSVEKSTPRKRSYFFVQTVFPVVIIKG